MKTKEEFKVGKHNIGYIDQYFSDFVQVEEFEPTPFPRFITLTRNMSDLEIKLELRPGLCTLSNIITLLDSDDPIYRDGNWNLFYLSSCVVGVYWDADGREWRVSTWERGSYEWSAGVRVFSPATRDFITQPSDTLNLETFDRRDLFAAFAMMGYIASPFREETKMDIIAQKAFRMADAMEKKARKSN